MNKLSIKITLAALVLLAVSLWILLPQDSTESMVRGKDETASADLVSAIQPISGANADSAGIASDPINYRDSGVKVGSLANDELALLSRRFNEANAAIDRGNIEYGLTGLEALISDYPGIIEPYLNVASIYAEQQDLEKARAVLLSGFSANPKAGMLFDHLKKVHGALAANSYRQALDTNSPSITNTSLVLARASSILTPLDQSNQIAALKKEIQESQNQAAESANQLQAEKVAALELKLNHFETKSVQDKSTYEHELSDLKKQIGDQSHALSLSQAAERAALARVVRAEQDAMNQIAEITEQLESQKTMVAAARRVSREQSVTLAKSQRLAQELSVLEAENNRLTEENKKLAQAVIAEESAISSASAMQKTQQQNAIELVKSWARAWSEQDVLAYVDHYSENYSSSRSLSREKWLEQRQVRLTNKQFINVDVSNFEVDDLGSRFSVTFSQYYRSNTVDDRVTKRLLFNKRGDDWSQSKILKEQLVPG